MTRYRVVCADGSIHTTAGGWVATDMSQAVAGEQRWVADNHGYACGPHRVEEVTDAE